MRCIILWYMVRIFVILIISTTVDPTRSTGRCNSLLNEKKKELVLSSFGKSIPQEERFCLESPLTFYFYFLKWEKPLIDSNKEKVVHEN